MILERIDPNTDQSVAELCRRAHIKRYEKAASYINSNDLVLDAGCGLGYGTEILSRKTQRVIGMDISSEAIAYAENHYAEDSIDYIVDDILETDLSQFGVFDLIVFFETIEHINTPEIVLERFRDNISDEGCLLLSTPNGNTPYVNNPHHFREYGANEVKELLERSGFQLEQVLGQYPLLGFLATAFNRLKWDNLEQGGEIRKHRGLVSAIPFVPEIFSGLYSGPIARSTSRQLFYIARPDNKS